MKVGSRVEIVVQFLLESQESNSCKFFSIKKKKKKKRIDSRSRWGKEGSSYQTKQ